MERNGVNKNITDVFSLLWAISSSAFIAALQVNQCMFEYTIDLSKLFQGSTQDVFRAHEEVTLVKDIFIDVKQHADAEYSEIYKMTLLGQ